MDQTHVRAWRWAGTGADRALVERQLELPTLRDDQVLVEVEASVIQASDILCPSGRTPGGAAVGRVVLTTASSAHLLGQRVVLGACAPCGECHLCRRGAVFGCAAGQRLGETTDGTWASHVVARGRYVLPLDGELDVTGPRAAAVAGPIAQAYALYAHASVSPGDAVVIIGDDVVAAVLTEVGRARGTQPVRGTRPDEIRTAAAACGWSDKPWKLFETTGAAGLRRLAVALAGHGANLTFHHAVGADEPLDIVPLIGRSATIQCVSGPHPDLLTEVAALVARDSIDLDASVHVWELDPDSVVAEFKATRQAGKCLVATLPATC